MSIRVARVAKRAIRDRQRILKARRLRLDLERGSEIVDRCCVIVPRQRGATGPIERGRLARRQRQRFGEWRLGGIGTSLDEPHVAEPDEGGDVVRVERQHALEQGGGFFRLVLPPVYMREE